RVTDRTVGDLRGDRVLPREPLGRAVDQRGLVLHHLAAVAVRCGHQIGVGDLHGFRTGADPHAVRVRAVDRALGAGLDRQRIADPDRGLLRGAGHPDVAGGLQPVDVRDGVADALLLLLRHDPDRAGLTSQLDTLVGAVDLHLEVV